MKESKTIPPSNTVAGALQISVFATRIPHPGHRDPFSGLCRSQMFAAIKSGRVKSYSLKHPGATRGVRLVDCASLRAYIEGFGDGAESTGTPAAPTPANQGQP